MRSPREADVLKACLQWLQLHGVFAWRSNNAGVLRTDPRTGRQWHQFSGIRGAPDILAILPPHGRLLAVETKRPGGKLSADQVAFLDAIRAAGGLAVVAYSVDDLVEALAAVERSVQAPAPRRKLS